MKTEARTVRRCPLHGLIETNPWDGLCPVSIGMDDTCCADLSEPFVVVPAHPSSTDGGPTHG